MTSRTYIRPLNRTPHVPQAVDDGLRLHLAEGSLDFADVEIIRRDGLSRSTILASAIEAANSGERDLEDALDLLTGPRPAISGLSLDRPRIMGIVNVTPDSFSDGGRLQSAEDAIAHGLRLEAEGADILDIGGESTRPGSDAVSLDEELRRVLPVIEGLAARSKAVLSIDTRKAEVMRRAAAAGATIINDVSALTHDPAALDVAADLAVPVVLMHAQGDPKTMQLAPSYDDCLLDVYDWLAGRIAACRAAGIPLKRLIVDPGIGFGKTLSHNLQLMAGLSLFHALGTPVLLGASRKSFIGRLDRNAPADRRMPGSIAVALAGIAQGAQIVRVHDVAETRQAIAVWRAATAGTPC